MSFQIRYKKGDDRRAINDMISYIGIKRSKILARAIKDGLSEEHLHFYASFAGVQGRPVIAFYNHFKNN